MADNNVELDDKRSYGEKLAEAIDQICPLLGQIEQSTTIINSLAAHNEELKSRNESLIVRVTELQTSMTT